MPKKNKFKVDVVSVRLVKDAPIYSEHPFNSPYEVVSVMGDIMCELDREVVCVINLKSDLTPINVHFASMGALNEAMAHPRELFKASILSNAASMMLVHCHPSGNLLPSKADTMMTDRMNRLCELIGISLIDHVIVGGNNKEFFSFKEKGVITNPRIFFTQDYKSLDISSPMVAECGKVR
jgi:DNA repair protein RadC